MRTVLLKRFHVVLKHESSYISIHKKDESIENGGKEEPNAIGQEKNSSIPIDGPEMQGGQDHRKNEHEHFKQRESYLLEAEKQHRPP